MVAGVCCTSGCSHIRGYSGEKIDPKRLVPDFLICRIPATLPMGSSWAMFFCQDVTDHCTLSGSADCPLLVCRDQSKPLLLGSEPGMGSCGLRWSYADKFWILPLGENCTDVHLARLNAVVQRASLDVLDISLARVSADVLGYEESQATRISVERASGDHAFAQSRERSLRPVAPAVGRWSSSMVTSLSWR